MMGKSKEKSKHFLILLVIVVGILLIGIGGFLGWRLSLYEKAKVSTEGTKNEKTKVEERDDKKEQESDKEEENVKETSEEEKEQKEDSYKDWKTYRNETFNILFKYPPDWILEEIVNDPSMGMLKVQVGKNGYKFEYYMAPAGSSFCVYPDTDESKIGDEVMFKQKYADYTEISSDLYVYRRTLVPELKRYFICWKSVGATGDYDYFVSLGKGLIHYLLPTSTPDPLQVEIMDKILISISDAN